MRIGIPRGGFPGSRDGTTPVDASGSGDRPDGEDTRQAPGARARLESVPVPAADATPAQLRALLERQRDQIAQLEVLIEAAPVGIGLVELDGRTPLTNATLRRLLGYTEQEFARMPFSAYTHAEDVAENDRLFAAMLAGEVEHFAMEKRFVRRDGSILWADLTVSLVRDERGRPDYAIGMTQDITARKQLADELRAAELHYRLLVEHVPAVVYISEPGPAGRWRYVSPRIAQVLGYSAAQWLADPGLRMSRIHPDDRAAVLRHEARAAEAGTVPAEASPSITYRMRHRDGHELWVRDDAMVLRDRHGKPAFHGVLVDVSQEKALEERLAHMADHDALTGLVNRAYFHRAVDATLAAAAVAGTDPRAVLLYVDLDDFKSVNDGFGHAVGDRVLAAVANALRHAAPAGSTIARLGGDEFAVLAPDGNPRVLAALVAEAVAAISLDAAGEPVCVTASVGAAAARRWHTTELLLHDADQAMYRSKVAGCDDAGARPTDRAAD